jgi:hypothetical protein
MPEGLMRIQDLTVYEAHKMSGQIASDNDKNAGNRRFSYNLRDDPLEYITDTFFFNRYTRILFREGDIIDIFYNVNLSAIESKEVKKKTYLVEYVIPEAEIVKLKEITLLELNESETDDKLLYDTDIDVNSPDTTYTKKWVNVYTGEVSEETYDVPVIAKEVFNFNTPVQQLHPYTTDTKTTITADENAVGLSTDWVNVDTGEFGTYEEDFPNAGPNTAGIITSTQYKMIMNGTPRVAPYNFNTSTPTQAALTNYVVGLGWVLPLPNGITVINLYDQHKWQLDLTNPTQTQWEDLGVDAVIPANTNTVNLGFNGTQGALSANVKYVDSNSIDFSDSTNGLTAAVKLGTNPGIQATSTGLTLKTNATNTITPTVDTNGLSAVVKYVDSNSIDFSDSTNGLTGSLRTSNTNSITLATDTNGVNAKLNTYTSATLNLATNTSYPYTYTLNSTTSTVYMSGVTFNTRAAFEAGQSMNLSWRFTNNTIVFDIDSSATKVACALTIRYLRID